MNREALRLPESVEADIAQQVDRIRGSLANAALLTFAIAGLPALLASLSRIPDSGWRNAMLLHVVAYVSATVAAILRNRLTVGARVAILLSLTFAIGIGALFAVLTQGVTILILGVVLTTILVDTRSGVIALVACLLTTLSFGLAGATGLLSSDFDLIALAVAIPSWATCVLGTGLFTLLAVSGVSVLRGAREESILGLAASGSQLEIANEKLRGQIIKRKAANEERGRLERELGEALALVVKGFLPICMHCERIREDETWMSAERYLQEHSAAQFSLETCDVCAKEGGVEPNQG